MKKLESVGEAFEATLDGAIENIVAHADAQATQEGGSDLILDHQIGPVLFRKTYNHALAGGVVDLDGAFHGHLAALKL